MIKRIISYRETLLNLFWRALQTTARNGFSFAIFYLASMFLPKEEFGYYSYLLKMAFFATLFVDFGISLAVSKYTAEYSSKAPSQIKLLLAGKVGAIMLLAVPAMIVLLVWGMFYENGQHITVTALLPLVVLVPLSALFDAVFRGMKRFRELSVITTATGLFSLVFFYVLIKQFGLLGAFYAQNLFYLCMLVGLWWRFPVNPFPLRIANMLKHYKYALTIGVIGVFMFLSTQVDVLFLGHFGYFTEVAYYEIILRFYSFVMMPLIIIGHVLSPDFTQLYSSGQYAAVRQKLKMAVLFSLMAAITVTVTLYFAFPPTFSLFFPKYNTEMLQNMSHVMLLLFFSGVFNGFIPLLAIATGHARLGMYFITVVGVLNVVLDYVSLTQWGVWGLIYSTVILKSAANMLFVVYYYWRLPR